MSKPPGQTQANVHSSILHHIFGMAGCRWGGGLFLNLVVRVLQFLTPSPMVEEQTKDVSGGFDLC